MIKPDMIPDEVSDNMRAFFHTRGDAQRAIADALNAWPGSEYVYRQPHRRAVSYSSPAIILPLPQDASDE